MRIVLSDRPRADHLLPDAGLLASVKDLGARFPRAQLRPLALVRARELDARADASLATRVWIAAESMQVTGSFKVRGALVAIDALKKRGAERIVAASAGNHGAGVAYAGHALGVRATVFVPSSTPKAKVNRMAAFGADVRLASTAHYDDAQDEALRFAEKEGVPYLSAYDDVDVVAGNGASLGFDIVRALGRVPERVIAPVGGGGLPSGLACALATESGDRTRRVWGAQSEACPAMAMSLESGVAVERLSSDDTLADGLEGGILARAFERTAGVIAGVAVVSERDVAAAMAHAVREMGLVIEGSAACSLAAVLAGLPEPMRGGDAVAVLTGRNVDPATIQRVLSA